MSLCVTMYLIYISFNWLSSFLFNVFMVDKELRALMKKVSLPTPVSPISSMPDQLHEDLDVSESDEDSGHVSVSNLVALKSLLDSTQVSPGKTARTAIPSAVQPNHIAFQIRATVATLILILEVVSPHSTWSLRQKWKPSKPPQVPSHQALTHHHCLLHLYTPVWPVRQFHPCSKLVVMKLLQDLFTHLPLQRILLLHSSHTLGYISLLISHRIKIQSGNNILGLQGYR